MRWDVARPRRVRGGRRVLRGGARPLGGPDPERRVRRRHRGRGHLPRRSPSSDAPPQRHWRAHRRNCRPAAGPAHRRRTLLGERRQSRRHLSSHAHPSRAAVHRPGARREVGRVARARADRRRCSGTQSQQQRRYRILDTSVIIDGRIADICETGFVDGTLVVPQFVLKELQQIADSSDSLRRNRGRRGLDILQRIQKMAGLDVIISDADFPDVKEVDLKLIELARSLQGKIVTNDFNLNKVAQLRGVEVLNINELANSLKPVVLPGETMKVFILKEGKEYNQGVAYLDDGTMVVVDNARSMIGKTIDVVVTSVLQTTAGKMIFGRFIDATAQPTPIDARGWTASQADQIEHSAVPLVANGLLPHSRHFDLHDRPRHAVDPVDVRRQQGTRGALVRARMVVADSGDDRRGGERQGPRAGEARRDLRVHLESSEHLRHPGHLHARCRFSCASSRRSRSAAFRFSAGISSARVICSSIAVIPIASGILNRWRAGQRSHVADHFPEGTRSADGHVHRFKAGSFLLALEAGLTIVPLSVSGSRSVMRKGQLATCPGHVTFQVHRARGCAEDRYTDHRRCAGSCCSDRTDRSFWCIYRPCF